MPEKIVRVWDQDCRITVERQSKTRWNASGEHMGKTIQVKGSSATVAANRWINAAFSERRAQIFTEKMNEFLSLFVAAKMKTFRLVLDRIKTGQNVDPAFGTALMFEEECALLQAINILPVHYPLQTREEFEGLRIHQLFRDDLLYRGEPGIDTAGAPRGLYRAPLAGSWIVVDGGMFLRADLDGPSPLN
jgi:hypothetical protein